MKASLVIIGLLLCLRIFSQQKYTISVPTENYQNISAKKVPNVMKIMDLIVDQAKLWASIECLEKVNPAIQDALNKEMSNIKEESSYILTVNYNSCEFQSLIPDKGTGGVFAPTSTVYYIKLYPKIDTKAPAVNNPANVGKKALLATYPDANGNWIAMGPYMTSDPYATEKQAIDSLFYSADDLHFIGERGKFRIYSLNEALKYDGLDVRQALKQMGIDNIPDN